MSSEHWDKVYTEKKEDQVSWFQEIPEGSLNLIKSFNLPLDTPVIDIGGGESRLAEHLLRVGFTDLTVLDISEVALKNLEARLTKENLSMVKFICSNVTTFLASRKYKLWHDRATFHFLTSVEDIETYLSVASDSLTWDGFLIVSTFASSGPDKCSGLPISKYSQEELKHTFGKFFETVRCFEETHTTPWGAKQDFIFCGFKKKKAELV